LNAKKIGKYKPVIEFELFHPFHTGVDNRALIMRDSDFMRLTLVDSKSLFLQIGEALGISEKKLRKLMDDVPYVERPLD
jgi:hypothetical protein